MESDKPPRKYFSDYVAAGDDRELQRQALNGLPEEWRDLLKTYIKIHKGRQNERDAKQSNQSAHGKRF